MSCVNYAVALILLCDPDCCDTVASGKVRKQNVERTSCGVKKELLSIVTHFNLAHFTLKALGLRSRHCFIDLCLSSSLESCKGNIFLDCLEIKTKISWAVWVLRNVILIGESELIVSTYFFPLTLFMHPVQLQLLQNSPEHNF